MKAIDNIRALLETATDVNLTMAFHLAAGQGIDLDDCSPICYDCKKPIGYNWLVSGGGNYLMVRGYSFFVCEKCLYKETYPHPY